MKTIHGSCACGKIKYEALVTIESFSPRACDCDFCLPKHIRYFSDPGGSVQIHVKGPINYLRQGSEKAEFLQCASCGDVACALYRSEELIFAALNASLSKEIGFFTSDTPVSPKLLDEAEKIKRWSSLWFADVRIATA